MTIPEAAAQIKSQPRPSAPGPVTATTEGITSTLTISSIFDHPSRKLANLQLSTAPKPPHQAAQPHPNGRWHCRHSAEHNALGGRRKGAVDGKPDDDFTYFVVQWLILCVHVIRREFITPVRRRHRLSQRRLSVSCSKRVQPKSYYHFIESDSHILLCHRQFIV